MLEGIAVSERHQFREASVCVIKHAEAFHVTPSYRLTSFRVSTFQHLFRAMKNCTLYLAAFLLATAPQAFSNLVNVALDAPAFSSGPLWADDTPARLTDGLLNLQVHASAAPSDGFAFWIDLGKSQTIDHLNLWPRQDGFVPERFSNIRVSVHADDGTGNLGAENWHADLFTDGSHPASTPGTVVVVRANQGVGTLSGRWVKLTALSVPVPDYWLQLDEVEVFAEGPLNVALGAAVTASSPIYPGFTADNLVNGDRGSRSDQVVHGDVSPDSGFHYDINLGAVATIERIKIIARQDGCCPERLSNYRVSVHKDVGGTIGDPVWSADMHTDGSNAGSGPGALDVLTSDLDPAGTFVGQWIRIESLDDPVPNYALQMNEVEVYGTLAGGPFLRVLQQPQSIVGGIGRSAIFRISVVATGGDAAALKYQWLKNGTSISGATGPTYTTPPLTSADETNVFRCLITYPGKLPLRSDAATIDIDYALGAQAFSNGPLWGPGGWNIGLIVDGNHDANGGFGGVHGDQHPPLGFAYWFNMGTKVSISNIVVWARQDGCCAGRLTNYRISVHKDSQGTIGDAVWQADLHTDGTNPGASAGSKDVITPDLDPSGLFEGQWVRIQSLEDPTVQDYALQLTEIEVFGSVPPEPAFLIQQQPIDARSAPFRSATFSVQAKVINGDPAKLLYQWFRNGQPILGANSGSYTTPRLCADDEGAKFYCKLSYPGLADLRSSEVALAFDYNYALGGQAFANQPLWGPAGWNISMLINGDRNDVFHGDTGLQPGFAYTVRMTFPVDVDHINLYPRQDGCCASRFSNFHVSLHDDLNGSIGDENWGADLFTDGSNPGASAGTVVTVTADQGAGRSFSGQWVKIESLDNPVGDYSLQMTELEVIGKAHALCSKETEDGKLILSWDSGSLESAPSLSGPWNSVAGGVSPVTISASEKLQFYRVRIP